MNRRPVQVLVVEDSPVVLALLTHILESDPELRIAGAVRDGEAALEFLSQNKPDVILMDIHMPKMDGFEATRRIMETVPTPIVICSGTTDATEVNATFHALEAGALAFVSKPTAPSHPNFEAVSRHLTQTLKLMAEIRVVRRWPRRTEAVLPQGSTGDPPVPSGDPPDGTARALSRHPARVVGTALSAIPVCESPLGNAGALWILAIGASTGGPPVVQSILAGLPHDFPAPILIVQHITPGFLPGLVEWLAQTTRFPVHIATHGEPARPGHVYLAPDFYHLGVNQQGRLTLVKGAAENGLCPSVAHLFQSVGQARGANAIAVLLTGMGRDGVDAMKALRDLGAVTIAQDEETSVVHGMPGAAIELGAASHVLPPEQIAALLPRLVKAK